MKSQWLNCFKGILIDIQSLCINHRYSNYIKKFISNSQIAQTSPSSIDVQQLIFSSFPICFRTEVNLNGYSREKFCLRHICYFQVECSPQNFRVVEVSSSIHVASSLQYFGECSICKSPLPSWWEKDKNQKLVEKLSVRSNARENRRCQLQIKTQPTYKISAFNKEDHVFFSRSCK